MMTMLDLSPASMRPELPGERVDSTTNECVRNLRTSDWTSNDAAFSDVIIDDAIGRAVAPKGHHEIRGRKQSDVLPSVGESRNQRSSAGFLANSLVILTSRADCEHDDPLLMTKEGPHTVGSKSSVGVHSSRRP